MFGLVKSGREARMPGGEVIRIKKRRMKIFIFFIMLIAFLLVNLVLFYLTDF